MGPQPTIPPDDAAGAVGPGQFLELVLRHDGPPDTLIEQYLHLQCRYAGALEGAVFQGTDQGAAAPVAAFPPAALGPGAPPWWAQAAAAAADVLAGGRTVVRPLAAADDLYGQRPSRHVVLVPLGGSQPPRHVGAFLVQTADAGRLAAARDRLELTGGLLGLYAMRLSLRRREADLERLSAAMEVLSAVGPSRRFGLAAMALCNEAAARWGCDRVALGLLMGRYVRLRALSHTEKFHRKMELVQDIEAAMEECLDQDVEIVHPAPADAVYGARATAELAHWHGPMAVLSLPLRWEGEVRGVLTLQRPADRPFSLEEAEALRVTCDLCAPRIVALAEQDRWFGAKLAGAARAGLAAVLGPRHTWWKVAAVAISALLAVSLLGWGDYEVEAPFVLEAVQRRVVPAPFDGELAAVHVRVGQEVEANAPLAALDTSELRLRLGEVQADRAGYLKQADAAMAEGKTAEAQISQARARGAEARMALLEYQLAHAELRAPVAGTVIAGDLERRVGAQVRTGDVLFEVAPLGWLRAELSVGEGRIADVRRLQRGELAVAGQPGRRVAFEVEHIDPVAHVADQRNVFRVRVRLAERPDWFRPGLEGLARIHVDRRRLAWLWTYRLVDWLRLRLWV